MAIVKIDSIAMASKRKDERSSLFLTAAIAVEGARAPVSVRVRNLSEGGMMVDGHVKLVCGARIEAELRGIGTVGGRIAWVEAGRAGVAFDEPVDPKLARAGAALPAEHKIVKAPPIYDRRPGLRARD